MDPFVVVSFGKKVFRTRVIWHCLNPVWEERLLFHVRDFEQSFCVLLTALDWGKLSSNDYVGCVAIEIADLVASVPMTQIQDSILRKKMAPATFNSSAFL
jgi:phosphatidylserine decarboxylase